MPFFSNKIVKSLFYNKLVFTFDANNWRQKYDVSTKLQNLTAYCMKYFLFKNWDLPSMYSRTQFLQRFLVGFYLFLISF